VLNAKTLPGGLLVNSAGSANLTIDGVILTGTGGATPAPGLKCQIGTGTATVIVKNSLLQQSGGAGVDSSGCTLVIDSDARRSHSTVARDDVVRDGIGCCCDPNAVAGVAADDIGVDGSAAGGIACNAAATITDSIVVGNNLSAPTGTQFIGTCTLAKVVVGTDSTADGGAIKNMSPSFVSGTDFHLKPSDAANMACCVDKIPTDLGTANSDHDVDSTKRKKGLGWDYGAHEVQ